jgi:hypothetical protein
MSHNVLHPELEQGLRRLRGQLSELLAATGADIRKPQDVSRRLKLDKSLTWKLSKVVGAAEPQTALQHVPGDAAMTLVTRAATKAGADAALIAKVDQALANLREMVTRHVGDKPTLDLVVDAMPDPRGERLTASRRLAFRGNSAIWGVQAAARLNAIWIAPSQTQPNMIDTALVGGWLDFRRLRHDAHWVLFRRRSYTSQGSATTTSEPIDEDAPRDGPLLMREFCSPSMPTITTTIENGTAVSDLGPSTIGNSGAFDCFLGSFARNLGSRLASTPGERANFHANVSAPVEALQFDVFVHRECSFALKQHVQIVGKLAAMADDVQERDLLPIPYQTLDLGSSPPIVATPLVPRYNEITSKVFARCGWNADDFSGTRYLVDYPPFPTTVIVSMPLDGATS